MSKGPTDSSNSKSKMQNSALRNMLKEAVQTTLRENLGCDVRPQFGAATHQNAFVESMLQHLCVSCVWEVEERLLDLATILWMREAGELFDYLMSWSAYGLDCNSEWVLICESYREENPIHKAFLSSLGIVGANI